MTSTLEERVALWTMDEETLANLCVNAACALRDTGQVQPVLHFYNDLMFGDEEQKILLFELQYQNAFLNHLIDTIFFSFLFYLDLLFLILEVLFHS